MNAEARRLEERRAQRAAEREGRRTRRRRGIFPFKLKPILVQILNFNFFFQIENALT